MFRKIFLTFICLIIPFAESFALMFYYVTILDWIKPTPSIYTGNILIITFIISILKNVFIYLKFSKHKLEKIILSALVIGIPGILLIFYFLFYYFPFVHTPQKMGAVVLVYFFLVFFILIFISRILLRKILKLFKKKNHKTDLENIKKQPINRVKINKSLK